MCYTALLTVTFDNILIEMLKQSLLLHMKLYVCVGILHDFLQGRIGLRYAHIDNVNKCEFLFWLWDLTQTLIIHYFMTEFECYYNYYTTNCLAYLNSHTQNSGFCNVIFFSMLGFQAGSPVTFVSVYCKTPAA
jgi:hypothetical protein